MMRIWKSTFLFKVWVQHQQSCSAVACSLMLGLAAACWAHSCSLADNQTITTRAL